MALFKRDEYLAQLQTETCPICYEILTTPVKTTCKHSFCRECLTSWLKDSSTCPSCRNKLFESEEEYDDEEDEWALFEEEYLRDPQAFAERYAQADEEGRQELPIQATGREDEESAVNVAQSEATLPMLFVVIHRATDNGQRPGKSNRTDGEEDEDKAPDDQDLDFRAVHAGTDEPYGTNEPGSPVRSSSLATASNRARGQMGNPRSWQ